jgi:hypothetical protein
MIKSGFIKSQVSKSVAAGQTSNFIRRLAFSVVDSVAAEHYCGSLYSTKCLQVSAAIQSVLNRLGIESELWMGAVCVAEVFEELGHEAWGGFWDRDHHIWLVTAFREYVDLGIAQAHRHPRSRRADGIPIPALWWSDVTRWPSVIRYLPDSPISIGLEGEDARDLAEFQADVMTALDRHIASSTVHDTRFPRMLTGVESMNAGTEQGDRWLTRAIALQERGTPFPSWIREREHELTTLGTGAQSRLIDVPGLAGP